MLHSYMSFWAEVTLSSKGQFTVPKRIRERLGIRAGDKLEITVEDEETILARPVKQPPTLKK